MMPSQSPTAQSAVAQSVGSQSAAAQLPVAQLPTGSPTSHRSLSVVIPLYQEAENVAPLLERVHEGLASYPNPWELILVDDGSRDATPARLEEGRAHYGEHVRVIRLRRNFGQTAAMQAGFDAARGTFIATLDGDLQNDPAEIPRLLDELVERDLDLLQGWRQHRQDALLIRKIPSRIANRLIGKVTGVRLHDYGCSLKVYRAEVIKDVRLYGEMHRFIPVWVASVTSPARIGETAVGHQARQFGESKYGISRTFRVLLDLLVAFFFLRFGGRPGHFFGSIGLSFGALGSLLMAHLLVVKFSFGEDIGQRPLLFVAILLLVASVQLLTTGVLAEMLVRTFFASSRRTHYGVLPDDSHARPGWKRAD
ncbi:MULTISPECIES: glycosyltransferase family 2 protein [Thiorhodovibrio]|uniref:glycosyltransferase family 2 protein n=1 Tax=Thiorhodovibrio TaxID=61593 RepID=UPI001F5DBA25|nr:MULTISPECIES: glycosyltransferase family 2 protein [Thiorhodovibrio]